MRNNAGAIELQLDKLAMHSQQACRKYRAYGSRRADAAVIRLRSKASTRDKTKFIYA